MASTDLPANRVIAAGDVALVQTTRRELSERNLPLNEVMMTSEQVIGRRLQEPMKQGDAFLTSSLYLDGVGPNLAEQLPRDDYRAVSLNISDLATSSIMTGSYVDVVFRSEPQQGAQLGYLLGSADQVEIPEVTVTLVEAVRVLDIEDAGEDQFGGSDSTQVILAVPAAKANVLQAVEGRGRITLVSRPAPPPPDQTTSSAVPDRLTLADVLGVQPPETPFQTVIVYRGQPQVNTFIGDRLQLQGLIDCPGCDRRAPRSMVPVPDPSSGRSPTPAPPPPAGADDGRSA
jgi:Flp pilus assembly protein CpaB